MIDTTRWEKVHGKIPNGLSYWNFVVNITPEEFDRKLRLHRSFELSIRGNWVGASNEAIAQARRFGLLTTCKFASTSDKDVRAKQDFLNSLKSDTIYLVP